VCCWPVRKRSRRYDEGTLEEAFSPPRFKALYRMWKQDGDRVVAELGSAALNDAVTAAAGQVETLELGHR
jgi:hypothetical protein